MTLPSSLLLRSLPIPAPIGPTNVVTVPGFQHVEQDHTFWCWAAVTVAIDRFYKSGVVDYQCKVVNKILTGGVQCCGKIGASSQCNKPADTGAALDSQGHLRPQAPSTVLSANQVILEIDQANPHPIACSLTGKGGGHAVTIIGRDNLNGTLRVLVSDPAYSAPVPYDYLDFVSNSEFAWSKTHFTQ